MQFPSAPTPSFPYQIEDRAGIGSMGVVYRAREVGLDRLVALKTLRPSVLEDQPDSIRDEMFRRFQQEARAAARLTHPGATTVYRVGEIHDMPYLAMEWLDGRDLDEVMAERGQLEPSEAVAMVIELLDVLQAAHAEGIVHRDVKPSNLMILRDGRLKVTDFGIARMMGQELVKTQVGVVLATPKFASPEQLRGLEVDARSDLYSAGVVLYHLLSGAFPFDGPGFLELANAVLTAEAPLLRDRIADLPPALDAVVQTALRKERSERYANAKQMADDLRAFQSPSPRPISTLEETQPTPRAPVLHDMPRRSAQALVRYASSWPARELDAQSTEPLVARLLETPLHAEPFAGAVVIEGIWLFMAQGVLLGAIDARDGSQGDSVADRLPAFGRPRLHPLPEPLPRDLLPVLTSLLHPPRVVYGDLDSSFVDLPALARKLGTERFNGVFRLRHGQDQGLSFFVDGDQALSWWSNGWESMPLDASWRHWVADHPVRAQVEKQTVRPPSAWFRLAFADLGFEISMAQQGDRADAGPGSTGETTGSRLLQLFGSTRQRAGGAMQLALRPESDRPPSVGGVGFEQAPAARLLHWLAADASAFFAERGLESKWKYLVEWLPLVRRAVLYHELPRPKSRETDAFDLVTFDTNSSQGKGKAGADGKVLHLGHRLAEPTPEAFASFLETVVAAKTARTKTGDIGGVILVIPTEGGAASVPEPLLAAWREATAGAVSKSWFGAEEAFTGYDGFVRMGSRRGFHLLLVAETEDGFEPILG